MQFVDDNDQPFLYHMNGKFRQHNILLVKLNAYGSTLTSKKFEVNVLLS